MSESPAWIGMMVRLARSLLHMLRFVRNFPGDFVKRRKCLLMPGAILHPCSRIQNNQPRASIRVGPDSHILGELLTFGHGGQVRVGARCYVGENTRIWSAASIDIGDRVLISHGVNIHDNNSHSLSAQRRAAHFDSIFSAGHPRVLVDVPAQPVVVNDDAWIGFGTTILKGVTIGKGAVVGACSLVLNDVEPFTVVAGNPAKLIRRLAPDNPV